jgi:hypothetical protein
VEVVQEVV